MRTKKGFTLIELLAVIVILAIIALIVTPLIMNVISDSKEGAYASQKTMIEHAAELYYASHADEVTWDGDSAYILLGDLKDKGYLKENITSPLSGEVLSDDTMILVYIEDNEIFYSLQLYDDKSFDWYGEQMVSAVKKMDLELPTSIGETVSVNLDELIDSGETSEIRIPTDITNRCVGYVEIEKTGTETYDYTPYIDCLLDASTFVSSYVSFGSKYDDQFEAVIETSDGGFIAVGRSNSEEISKYNITSNGGMDALIVKYDSEGNILWASNFGGSISDRFWDVVEVADGYIAVGETTSSDLEGFHGGTYDALLVKYDKDGNLVSQKIFGGSGNQDNFFNVIIDDNNHIIATGSLYSIADGDLSDIELPANSGAFMSVNVIFNMDFSLNDIIFFGGSKYDIFYDTIQTSDGGYLSVGYTNSSNGDVDGLKYITTGYNYEGVIVKYDSNFTIENIQLFSGTGHTYFNSVVEVADGYIVAGNSVAADNDMEGLNISTDGTKDALIVKYDKTLENVMWKKTFGGTKEDNFENIIIADDNTVIAVGYSKSSDSYMNGISKSDSGYRNAILVKYNISNGNIVTKKVFGGSNTDIFKAIIKTSSNNYVLAGYSYSNNKDLKNFNKGHSDAIMVAYDSDLNLTKIFNEEVVIIDKIDELISNYGTSLSSSYDAIYTTNNPNVDLLGWCSSYSPSGINNYDYGQCLKPFNDDDMKLLNDIETPNYYKTVISGEKEYTIDNEPDDYTNWLQLHLRLVDGITDVSDFKIKFSDGYIGSIEECVENGYIEPLVIASNILIYSPYSERTYPDTTTILYDGYLSDSGSYSDAYLILKPKKEIVSFIFTSSRTMTTNIDRGFSIYELRNFDMSITTSN
ncbi:MAG: prepilin-type N-terminal cleavage/methylation domain-containing protein [Bacilli bacterium]|nr:prepilin-type N-terminal cleavage/methylation domain-containing protein [Bacilli bacterium]